MFFRWLVIGLAVGSCSLQAQAPGDPGAELVLARVAAFRTEKPPGLAVHEWLQAGDGTEYWLVFATRQTLESVAPGSRVLADPAGEATDYLLARPLRAGAAEAARARWTPLLDDGRQWLLRLDDTDAQALAEMGFAIKRLTAEPLSWPGTVRSPKDGDITWDGRVAEMVNSVQPTNLLWLVRRISGEDPVLAAGEPVVITTRYTTSNAPLNRALNFACERFKALGLAPQFAPWTNGAYTGRNLAATLPGTTRSNELVLITAHLDDMPNGVRAPGADDNASGCAAVLTAAGALRQFRFERSLRFVLFTGEEQGLLGSARYAQAAQAAGEKIFGVLNLDMLAWSTNRVGKAKLYTRTVTNAGYASDLVIAATFTNAASVYGLRDSFDPVIAPQALPYSDHASFWNRGYPAVVLIEDYGGDFTPYYHTINDVTGRVNWSYFTGLTRCSLATAAHLARLTQAVEGDVIGVAVSTWGTNSGIGAGEFFAQPRTPGSQSGVDGFDLAWAGAAWPSNAAWLRAFTEVAGVELQTDARPADGDAWFAIHLGAGTTNGQSFAVSNRLRFEMLAPAGQTWIYTARVQTMGAFTATGEAFLCVTNLREAMLGGGYVALPNLVGLTNGARFGLCELVARPWRTNQTDCPLTLAPLGGTGWQLVTRGQVGTYVVDRVESTPALVPGAIWTPVMTLTNRVAPDPANFESGWQPLVYPLAEGPTEAARYYRLRRSWLPL